MVVFKENDWIYDQSNNTKFKLGQILKINDGIFKTIWYDYRDVKQTISTFLKNTSIYKYRLATSNEIKELFPDYFIQKQLKIYELW
jgi:hypothetical protein